MTLWLNNPISCKSTICRIPHISDGFADINKYNVLKHYFLGLFFNACVPITNDFIKLCFNKFMIKNVVKYASECL